MYIGPFDSGVTRTAEVDSLGPQCAIGIGGITVFGTGATVIGTDSWTTRRRTIDGLCNGDIGSLVFGITVTVVTAGF